MSKKKNKVRVCEDCQEPLTRALGIYFCNNILCPSNQPKKKKDEKDNKRGDHKKDVSS